MITAPVDTRDGLLHWPSDVPDNAYLLAYTHSQLLLERGPKPLNPGTLYEAWMFDGEASWHLWLRDWEWVFTKFDSGSHDGRFILEHRQVLSDTIVRKLAVNQINARYLIIREWIQFDGDGQAFVAYSCPINLG